MATGRPTSPLWEYTTVSIVQMNSGDWRVTRRDGSVVSNVPGQVDSVDVHNYLTALGEEGWEMCGTMSTEGAGTLFFKHLR